MARPPNTPRRGEAGTAVGASGAKRRIRALGGAGHRLAVAGAADPRICAAAIDSAARGTRSRLRHRSVRESGGLARNSRRGLCGMGSLILLLFRVEAVRGGGEEPTI